MTCGLDMLGFIFVFFMQRLNFSSHISDYGKDMFF